MRAVRSFLVAALFAAFCSTASAQSVITAHVLLTNTPAGLTSNLVVSIGTTDTRRPTNAIAGVESTHWMVTNTIAWARSNLYAHLSDYPVYSVGAASPRLLVSYSATNSAMLELIAPENTNITVTAGAGWASIHYSTQTFGVAPPILSRTDNMSAQARTNAGNAIINLLSDGSVESNSIPPGSYAFRHITDNTSSQNLSNKTLTGAVLSGGRFNNITNGTGTNVAFTNVTLHIASITGADLSGLINLITNGSAYSLNLINATNRGIVVALTNGIWTNGILLKPKMTNGVNYGDAFSSPTITAGEQFGAFADSSGVNSLAVGNSAVASGVQSTALGYSAQATNSGSLAVGNNAIAGGVAGVGSAIAVGTSAAVYGAGAGAFGSSTVSGDYSFSFGHNNTVTHTNATVIGNSITSSADNRVQVGSGSQNITLAGPVTDSTLTNTTLRGITTLNGRLDLTSGARTSLANGYNSGTVLGTNAYIRLSGASGAATNAGFAAAADGSVYTVQVDNPGLSYTLLNESGLEATAANRIVTSTGALMNSTNNPVLMQLLYDATASRYRVLSFR